MQSKPYKHYVTVLLLVVYIFNQTDRAIFTLLMEPIRKELGFSDSQLGFLAGPALALFYATLGIPVARWADRSHRVNIMSGAIVLWSSIVMLSALAGKFWQLSLARIGVGIGEAGFSAVAQSVIADYHTAQERTRAMSIFMLAIPLGGVVSSLMGGWINEAYGWRAAFVAAGLPGIILAVMMKLTVREPARSIPAAVVQMQFRPSLRTVFATMWHRRALRHLAIATALSNLVAGGVLGWQATFFLRIHEMSSGELGTWLAFNIGIGGGAGVLLSGYMNRIFHIDNDRRQTHVLALSAILTCILWITVLLWPDKLGALLLMFAATVVAHFFFAPSFSLVQGLCTANMRATVLAVVIFLQILFAGVIGLQLTGILSDVFATRVGTSGLRWAMVVMTPIALWSGLHFLLAGRSIRQDLQQVAAGAEASAAAHAKSPAADASLPHRAG